MAKSLDPSSIVVAPASGGTVSPFDCSTGPIDDNNNGDLPGLDGGWDDSDFPGSGC
jgi:hypothetical protein